MHGPIGFNFLRGDEGIWDLCERTRPHACVFFEGALPYLERIQEAGLVRIAIARKWLEGNPDQIDQRLRSFALQPIWPTAEQSYDMGRLLAQTLVSITPWAHYFQDYNEWANDTNVDRFYLYCAFLIGFLDGLQENGKEGVILNPPVGNLTPDTFLLFREALARASFLGVHTYGADPRSHNPGQLMSIDPQYYDNQPLSWILEARLRGIRVPPLIRTEAGTYFPWKPVHGDVMVFPVSSQQVADDIIWMAQDMLTRPFEAGMCLWQAFSNGDHRWDCFELANELSILERIERFNAEHPVPSPQDSSSGTVTHTLFDQYIARYGEGFANALLKHSDLVGRPLQTTCQVITEQENVDGDPCVGVHLRTEKGRLLWEKRTNRIFFSSDEGITQL